MHMYLILLGIQLQRSNIVLGKDDSADIYTVYKGNLLFLLT